MQEEREEKKKIINKKDVFSCTSCHVECTVSQLGDVENARMKVVPP